MFNITRANKIAYEFEILDINGKTHKQEYGTSSEKNFQYIEDLYNTTGIKSITLNRTKESDKSKINSISVDLENGYFLINGFMILNDFGIVKELNGNKVAIETSELLLRPIYFRRIRKTFTNDEDLSNNMKFALGFQATYNGINYKRYLLLDESGEFLIICDK